jgi:acetolactate synthase-1/2/3 large subunit
MSDSRAERTGGRPGGKLIVDALLANGVDRLFCVPGESYLAVLDALHDVRERIDTVVCRHEGGASYMAESYGKLTGKPGILFVTRGPGASNAAIGVHTAQQDSSPMVVFVGDVARDTRDREAFQEVDFRRFFGDMAKWVGEIDMAARIPEMVSHAFHLAMSGRPGPVVLTLPEDMQHDVADVPDIGPYNVIRPWPGNDQMQTLLALLDEAERPLLMVGGGGWSPQAAADITAFASANHLPVCSSFRCQDIVDNANDCWIGDLTTATNPALVQRVKQSDLLLVVGPRLGEITTQGYTLLDLPKPAQTLVHVHADAAELGRVFYPTLAINAGMAEFAAAAHAMEPAESARWTDWTKAARGDYLTSQEPGSSPGAVDMNEVMRVLKARLPENTIMANDAGNFSGWLHRYYQYRHYRSQLAPTSGAMGYGVPAAIAAAIAEPERTVVGWAGDGGFLMTGQEIATAMRHGAKPILLVVNNSMYGTIRMHQEREFPERVSGTDLANPDFAAFARSFGAFGAAVEKTADFAPALEDALAANRCALIEIRIDPEVISTRASLTQIRNSNR